MAGTMAGTSDGHAKLNWRGLAATSIFLDCVHWQDLREANMVIPYSVSDTIQPQHDFAESCVVPSYCTVPHSSEGLYLQVCLLPWPAAGVLHSLQFAQNTEMYTEVTAPCVQPASAIGRPIQARCLLFQSTRAFVAIRCVTSRGADLLRGSHAAIPHMCCSILLESSIWC